MTWHYPVNTGMSPTNFTRSQHSILFYIKGKKNRVFNKKDIAVPYKNLIIENYLGSTDPFLDKSSPGRGPKPRNSAGILVEITLDADNNIIIKEA